MTIDKYRVNPSAFQRYDDTFLQNSFKGHRFKIVLDSGDAPIGVPTSGSLVNPLDPNVSFTFKTDDGAVYRIPFAHLREAEVVDQVSCMVRTIDPTTVGGADFEVLILANESERLMLIDGPSSVVARVRTPGSFVEGAPTGTYKYLTVGGRDFRVKAIKGRPTGDLDISVEPL